MNFGKIGVILGGPSEEREISIHTGKAISCALSRTGHDVIEIGESGAIEDGILSSNIDIAFIALHGRYGEDGTIQKFMQQNNILYTGSGPEASYNALNKFISKEIFTNHNIPTPKYILAESNNSEIKSVVKRELEFPVVIKPINSGSSIGLSIVKNGKSLDDALQKAFNYSDKAIIEKYIAGQEITVGILGDAPLPVINIVPKSGCYDYTSKYKKGMTEYIVPAILPKDITRKVQSTALRAHKILGCNVFSRVDLRLDEEGMPWVLEVNTIPGFTETSLLPKAAASLGLGFTDLCEKILEMTIEGEIV